MGREQNGMEIEWNKMKQNGMGIRQNSREQEWNINKMGQNTV